MSARRPVVGTEVRTYSTVPFVTGVQRVMREAHGYLDDMLDVAGIDLVPLITRSPDEPLTPSRNPYLRSDPVLRKDVTALAEVDACLLLGPDTQVDFAEIFRARKERELPTICAVYDSLPLANPHWWPGGSAAAFRVLLQQVIRIADHLVVSTEKVRDDLLALPWSIPAQIHVIGLGTSFTQQPPASIDDGRVSVLYVSTLEPRKGHDVLLDAFDILRARDVDIDLTFIGRDGWNCDELFERIRAHPDFHGRLRWLRTADDLTVRAVARECNVGVFPSQGEGFGLFIEEGLSLGLAMVASDIPEFRERAQPNLAFSGPGAEDWAAAILAASAAPPQPIPPGAIRTMGDFAAELSALITDVVH